MKICDDLVAVVMLSVDCPLPSTLEKAVMRYVVPQNEEERPHVSDIQVVYGDVGNILEPTSIVYNVGSRKVLYAIKYFQRQESVA